MERLADEPIGSLLGTDGIVVGQEKREREALSLGERPNTGDATADALLAAQRLKSA